MFRNYYLAKNLAKKFATNKPDVVYTNSITTNFGSLFAHFLERPHIWHIREFGDLDYGLRPCFGNSGFQERVRSASAVVVVSKAVMAHHFTGPGHGQVDVVYDGVAREADLCERMSLANQHKTQNGHRETFVFSFVGLLQAGKGQHVAINALKQVVDEGGNAELWLIGDGCANYRFSCESLAGSLGVGDRVKFLGYQRDPNPYYLGSDAGLVCSDFEAYGLTTLESMSFCRPVIGHATGGTPELILDGTTGLLYREGVKELAKKMSILLQNRSMSDEMGRKASRDVFQRFSMESGLNKMSRVINDVYERSQTGC
jgi:glycosyltransferase involved in cell wall biosynthesis